MMKPAMYTARYPLPFTISVIDMVNRLTASSNIEYRGVLFSFTLRRIQTVAKPMATPMIVPIAICRIRVPTELSISLP